MKRHSCSALGVLGMVGMAACGEAVDFGDLEAQPAGDLEAQPAGDLEAQPAGDLGGDPASSGSASSADGSGRAGKADGAASGLALGTARQALSDVAQVFGFENSADWTLTQGVKSSSSDRSQGTASLGVSDFTFTTLLSPPLSTLPQVTDTLALDLKVPATPAWGELSIFVSIPSRNLFEQKVGQVPLAGLIAGHFHTASFPVPPSLVAALGSSYSDLRVKVALNAPQTSQSYLLDNLRFVGGTTASKVEIEMTQPIDDFFYASVDGLRQKIWYIGDPEQDGRVDATRWFGAGTHTLRLQAINTGGPASFGVRVWINDAIAFEESCPASTCNGQNAAEGILLDRSLTIETPDQPAAQVVSITSETPGKLYIDDGFTGLTTTGTSSAVSVSLPPGRYRFGLGVSDDTPPVYAGSYREQVIDVGGAPVSLSFAATPALPIQDETRIVVVPVRTLTVDPFDQSATLDDADLEDLEAQIFATRDEWLEPFSYGLKTWDVDFLPVVEDVALHAPVPHDPPDAGRFLRDADLEGLRAEYEIVLLYYNCFDESGDALRGTYDGEVVDFSASAWGGGGTIWVNPYWTRRWEPVGPNPALLHEALHNYEGYNQFNLHFYNGVQGMHGDGEHGYFDGSNGELDFAQYQRLYMRGQVAELNTTRPDVTIPAPPPRADLWVGVFDTMRRGYDPLGPSLQALSALPPVETPAASPLTRRERSAGR